MLTPPAGTRIVASLAASPALLAASGALSTTLLNATFANGAQGINFGAYSPQTYSDATPVVADADMQPYSAYAFARFDFFGKKVLFAIMVATMMLPQIVLRIPQYIMFQQFDMIDSYAPLILPSAFATDTFFVFMLVQFLRGIPRDMEEAAQMDGCNSLQMLWYIIVPLLKPAIISVIVFQFIWTMNDFIGPLIYLSSVEKYPVSLALKLSIGATEEVEWNSVIAISVLALVPSVAVFFAAQKHFVDGVASTGLKG